MKITRFNSPDIDTNRDKWALERWGKFTGSENHKLLSKGTGEMFGAGARTYIKQKALEMTINMYERPEMEENKTLLWGALHEQEAFEWYRHFTRNELIYCGTLNPLFLTYDEMPTEVGVSPDSVNPECVNTYKVDFGAELKCPRNPSIHFDRLLWKDEEDLKNNNPEYYCQIQNTFLITGAQQWHFVSYDGRQKDKKKRIKVIEVMPNKKYLDNLQIRLEAAVKEKYKILQQYQN